MTIIKKYVCTNCGGDAEIAMSSWIDTDTGKQHIKKGERLCMRCFKTRTGRTFSLQK